MKKSGFVVGLVLQFLAVCLCAQTLDKECSRKNKVKTLWVVDGVELNDSVFDYTLDQMRSDSAAVLASRVLSRVIVGEIRNYGTWSISQGDIILISSQDPAILLQGYTVSNDTVYLKINTTGALTLSPSIWNNKKSVTLKRQHNVSDR